MNKAEKSNHGTNVMSLLTNERHYMKFQNFLGLPFSKIYINTAIGITVWAFATACNAEKLPQTPFNNDLLFYASYNKSITADFAVGSLEAEGKVNITPAGILFNKEGVRYSAHGNINPLAGVLAFQFKPQWNAFELDKKLICNKGLVKGLFCYTAVSRFPFNCVPNTLTLSVYYSTWHKERIIALWWDTCIAQTSVEKWNKGEWRHVAIVWDETHIKLYINGSLVDRQKNNGPIRPPADYFFIGGGKHCVPADGWIKNVHIYRRAFNDNEIGILSGKPEFLTPVIRSFIPLQNICSPYEKKLSFLWEPGGLINPTQHSLRIELLQKNKVIFSQPLEVSKLKHNITLVPLKEGQFTLRLSLIDSQGHVIDKKVSSLICVTGPFDGK